MQGRTTTQAAEFLGAKRKTLENWRSTDRGPAYVKIGGRVLYPQVELDRYVEANTRRPSSR
jgi:predicted DNA-binding transcriptional regulator AlpA